jgi:vacuolar-type H+-ATPase subunit H
MPEERFYFGIAPCRVGGFAMKEIVERILREEHLARDRILVARKEAEDLLQKAKKDAASMTRSAVRDLARTIEQKRRRYR